MPINTKLLKEHMSACRLTVKEVAKVLDIDESTYYRRMASEGKSFTVEQAQQLVELLHLTDEEATSIFLAQNSRIREKKDKEDENHGSKH